MTGITIVAPLVALTLLLGACGNTTSDRAPSGGAIGAGTGAVPGVATAGSPTTGAVIGGGGGAVTGAVAGPQSLKLSANRSGAISVPAGQIQVAR